MVATVAVQPAFERRPLQRIGVLKLVQQYMLVTRVEARMQVGGVIVVGQQARRQPLDIGEVEHGARGLEGLVLADQGFACDKQIRVEGADALRPQRLACTQEARLQFRVQIEKACFAAQAQALGLRRAGRPGRARFAIGLEPDFAGFLEGRGVVPAIFQACQQGGALLLVRGGIRAQGLCILGKVSAAGCEKLARRIGLGIALQLRAQARQRERGGVGRAGGESPPLGTACDEREQCRAHIGQTNLGQRAREGLRRRTFGCAPQRRREALPGLSEQTTGLLDQGRAMRRYADSGGDVGGARRTQWRQLD